MRPPTEDAAIRPLYARADVNPGVAGSAYIELGSTKVMASAYAPGERQGGGAAEFTSEATLTCQVNLAPFAKRPRQVVTEQADEERTLSISVEQALRPAVLLERFPKAALEVHLVILQADGGELAACVAAAGLALVDAGIDMRDMPAAVTVGCMHAQSSARSGTTGPGGAPGTRSHGAGPLRLIVDPSADELASCDSSTTVAFLPRLGRLSHTVHSGRLPGEAFAAAMSRAMEACLALAPALHKAATDAARRRAKTAAKRGVGR